MNRDYSVSLLRELKARFQALGLHRPMTPQRYEPGDELVYEVTGLTQATQASVRLVIDRFVGGGFAGQVYRVKLLAVNDGHISGLEVGGLNAMKILIPPSGFAKIFRDLLYFLGFQAAFQLQVNPVAARSGALWQKFIRRAAALRFGDELSVVDIHATFVDSYLGSCGELSEWIEGRTWRLEVDDRLDLLRRWRRKREMAPELGSPEYRAKRDFMRDFVKLLHEVGAHEFARQYEWSTCKSQPNCLKRTVCDDDPATGLVAVDFRAGLALLPFLPMSPGDFKLILTGLLRGSLVQFDRGEVAKLEQFIQSHAPSFGDMQSMLEELRTSESVYRASTPDVTHNHLRLLYSRTLWSTIRRSAAKGWRIRGLVDEVCEPRLERSVLRASLFTLLGFVPLAGSVMRKLWCRPDWRMHYGSLLTRPRYFRQALRGKAMERAIAWHRAGRVNEDRARAIASSVPRFLFHLSFSILPVALHRFLTDGAYARDRLSYLLVRPFRLYFDGRLREEWLHDMVTEGRRKHILDDADAHTIGSQIAEPYIQKYLKCLVVHMCLMPTTHVVNAVVVIYFLATHRGIPVAQATAYAALITAAFQVTPISPGSLARGLYVLYLMIRERDFWNYNIAVFVSFFKYVGYLAFPIQMTYRYPTLARFMAGHWATEAVHVVPVFGEGGALLERKVFDLFYNWPLTLRRRMNRRAELRSMQRPRTFHLLLCMAGATLLLHFVDVHYLHMFGVLPGLRKIWWAAMVVPAAAGACFTLGAGGTSLGRRIVFGALCGTGTAWLVTALGQHLSPATGFAVRVLWRMFLFTLLSAVGTILVELSLPEPTHQR